MTIGEYKERAATVATEKLVDVAPGITWAMTFPRMSQDHSRRRLSNACSRVGIEGARGARPERGAGICTGPRGLTSAEVQVRRRSPTQSVFVNPSVMFTNLVKLPR